MIREAPEWFNGELERLGGTSPFGDPIFKLEWSPEPKMVVGGQFWDGFIGYRKARAIPGEACWALMIWEGPESYGSQAEWEMRYRQADTGCLEMGSFPAHGRYRLLKQFMHREVVARQISKMRWDYKKKMPYSERVQERRVITYRMEPNGFILDLMIPGLMAWRKLSEDKKMQAVMDRKDREAKQLDNTLRDAYHDGKVNPGSELVKKRAEFLERHMDKSMALACKYGRGLVTIA